MIGFTPNEVTFVAKSEENQDDDTLDFDKVREEVMQLQSVEMKDAYDEYNRAHRGL